MALHKLFSPSPNVKSRMHDGTGARAGASSLLLNFPRSVASRLMLNVFGHQPNRPWLSYNAVAILREKLASKPCRVLEFGSGASTAWFARRAAELHSVENNGDWFAFVKQRLEGTAGTATKVQYELRPEKDAYTTFRANSDLPFDIVLIDGPWRRECTQNHFHLIAPNGLLYLDNTDADSSTGEEGELAETLLFLNGAAAENGLEVKVFTDFVPCALHATQGILVHGPR